jgi:hypothetical protein
MSRSRIFHLYRDITIAGEGLQVLKCIVHNYETTDFAYL